MSDSEQTDSGTIRFHRLTDGLWEVVAEWGVFQADDLTDALEAAAHYYEGNRMGEARRA